MPALDAGAVDEDAHLVAVGEDLGHQPGDILGRAEIGRVDGGAAAEGADGIAGGCCAFVSLYFPVDISIVYLGIYMAHIYVCVLSMILQYGQGKVR